ncbi:MAG: NBR1-Ig-like domain-containing protein [Omnitrophica WOR_2 bacterium]
MLRAFVGMVALFASILLLSACEPSAIKGNASPTPNAIYTSAAKTVAARLTGQANEELAGRLTQAAATMDAPSQTPQPAVNTLPPSDTPMPPLLTDTPAPPTSTQPAVPCNRAVFVRDVDTKDGSTIVSDADFIKTWRIKNTGTCDWTQDYAFVFIRGDQMEGPDVQWLDATVAPGEVVDISVDMTAPTDPGTYTGYWELRDGSGILFGEGNNADQLFRVTIQVTAQPQVIYDFVDNYCDAIWDSGTGPLPCPAQEPDALNGFVGMSTSPRVESGDTASQPALIVHPNTMISRTPMPPDSGSSDNSNAGNNRYISGRFPAYKVKERDHLRFILGCLYGNEQCNVTFEVDYSINNGPVQNLGRWTQVFDGITTDVDISLKSLTGKNVEFILLVLSNGLGKEDVAYWLMPAIYR